MLDLFIFIKKAYDIWSFEMEFRPSMYILHSVSFWYPHNVSLSCKIVLTNKQTYLEEKDASAAFFADL